MEMHLHWLKEKHDDNSPFQVSNNWVWFKSSKRLTSGLLKELWPKVSNCTKDCSQRQFELCRSKFSTTSEHL